MRAAVLPAILFSSLRLAAQNPEALPEAEPPAEAPAPIAPVPLPKGVEIKPDAGAMIPEMPKNVKIREYSSGISYDFTTKIGIFPGPFEAETDNGTTLRADRARLNGNEMKYYAEGAVKMTTKEGM